MKANNAFSQLLKTISKNMEIRNQKEEQLLRCQQCNLPYFCAELIVVPIFSSIFGRQFVCEELFCDCQNCLFRIALPEPLSESNAILLQRRLERKMAKVIQKSFDEIVREKLVTVTTQNVFIRM